MKRISNGAGWKRTPSNCPGAARGSRYRDTEARPINASSTKNYTTLTIIDRHAYHYMQSGREERLSKNNNLQNNNKYTEHSPKYKKGAAMNQGRSLFDVSGSFFDNTKKLWSTASLIAFLATTCLILPHSAQAQTTGAIITPGDMAVTGFSGTVFPLEGLAPGVDPLGETFIDIDGASLRIFNIGTPGELPKGQLINTPPPFEVKASQIGQVFGLAFDDGLREGTRDRIPTLYATATSLHGLQVVVPDNDGDGRPERVKQGQAGASFMSGQFGEENGGGPGSIWKIDGATGEVSLFADVALDGTPNSGPGLGNIAFDKATRQLFISDLDTGMIHRFDLQGTDLGYFDHGQDGRPNHGLDAVAHDDTKRMDITDPGFETEKPETWGYADKRRLVHGLAVHGRRLYYAQAEPLQVWSVGINRDGSIAKDARWELDVNAPESYPVTDMAFDRHGFLYLAQRGDVQNTFDYATFAKPEKARVLRYYRETPDDPTTPSIWVEVPQEYAVGFPNDHRMATGGLDLGYGYDDKGARRRVTCDGTLAKTGDDLRNNPAYIDQLATGGATTAIHGVQLTDTRLVRPENEPPFKSYFVDYDNRYDDPDSRGHVGDVEIWRPCEGRRGYGEVIPGDVPEIEGKDPCIVVDAIDYFCGWGGDYDAALYLRDRYTPGADSLKANSLKPGVSVSPVMQTRPSSADPFWLGISGAIAGETVKVNVCTYRDADAKAGGTFPCCQAQIPLKMPDFTCAP